MKPSALKQKLTQIKDLATLPVIANNVIQMTRNPKTTATEVGRAISHDPALTAQILRIANSALYGFPQKITTVNHAIVVLGFANIRNMVLTASVFEKFPGSSPHRQFDREAFWEHSLTCGLSAKLLARKLGMKTVEEAFIWGLLHDLGKVVLDSFFNQEFTQAVQLSAQQNILLREAEEQIIGMNHAEIGGLVAEQWNLPPALIKAIRFHHEPLLAQESTRIAALVHLADFLCRSKDLSSGGDRLIPPLSLKAVQRLGLTPESMPDLLAEIETEAAVTDSLLPLLH
ncbi:MAG: HDOD domain-containing protein [Deltaproteobacteria bacterium]|nr:HDOD domain-containing protein [Deltaproteobacteria bacterium]